MSAHRGTLRVVVRRQEPVDGRRSSHRRERARAARRRVGGRRDAWLREGDVAPRQVDGWVGGGAGVRSSRLAKPQGEQHHPGRDRGAPRLQVEEAHPHTSRTRAHRHTRTRASAHVAHHAHRHAHRLAFAHASARIRSRRHQWHEHIWGRHRRTSTRAHRLAFAHRLAYAPSVLVPGRIEACHRVKERLRPWRRWCAAARCLRCLPLRQESERSPPTVFPVQRAATSRKP